MANQLIHPDHVIAYIVEVRFHLRHERLELRIGLHRLEPRMLHPGEPTVVSPLGRAPRPADGGVAVAELRVAEGLAHRGPVEALRVGLEALERRLARGAV